MIALGRQVDEGSEQISQGQRTQDMRKSRDFLGQEIRKSFSATRNNKTPVQHSRMNGLNISQQNFSIKNQHLQQTPSAAVNNSFLLNTHQRMNRHQSNYNVRSLSPNRASQPTSLTAKYFQEKERILKDQLLQQDLQIHFLKERLAKVEVAYDNDTHQSNELIVQLTQKDHQIRQMDIKLYETVEQVQLVQDHCQNLQELMRRDQLDKERLLAENKQLRRENKEATIECERMRAQCGKMEQERKAVLQRMIKYETVSTQLEEALKKIDEQQELMYQLQRQYEHAVKKKDSYKESATKARERNATLSQEYIKLQATVNKRNLQSQEYQNDENMSQNIPNQLVTFNAGKSITRSTKSGEIQQLKPPKQSYHHPMSTKVFRKTFELDATTSCDVNPDQESVKQLGATFPTQDKARQGDFSGLTDQHLSQRRHNPMTFESEGENSRVLQRVDEGSSSESDETTEGMGVKSKGMLRDQINFYQKKLQRLLI